jgi:hypothetical protein
MWFATLASMLLSLATTAGGAEEAAAEMKAASNSANYTTESLRGRVVWLADAMRRRFGVETDPDAQHAVVALETPDGRLFPIVKDARGRGFHKDPRLFEFNYELVVRRFAGAPEVQVIRVYTIHDGNKYELDYWCDICAIPMFELKECECCQGPIRFREQLAGPAK